MTTTPAPARTYLPLAQSPLLTGPSTTIQDADLAVRLAATADPDPATIRSLLSITRPEVADRITATLEERTDLPPAALALLIAHRPDLKKATGHLKNHLFPSGTGACHRFTRTIAALAHQPESIDGAFLTSERFTQAATAADPAALQDLLAALLASPLLSGPADAGLGALLAARRAGGAPTAPFDLAVAATREATRRTRIGAALAARREQTIREIAEHTSGLTMAAELWYDALTAAADTPEHAAQALAWACLAGATLHADQDPQFPWPAARARWQQVTAAARTARAHPPVWEQAWEAAAATADGSAWDPVQRSLVAGYDLLADHVRTAYGNRSTPPTPTQCWAADPAGRALLHTIADHLTGHLGHSPLPHFDDVLLISFIRGLAKNRRDKIPGAVHIHGLVAAIKAARSKTHLLTRPAAADLGIVVPTRGEAHRIQGGENALTAKIAQLAWLLGARPDARAEILLVDEDPDSASARAAAQIPHNHPQILLTIATHPDEASAKGGAVLWGLSQLLTAGHTTLAYTDLDLTYPLDQLGLLLNALDRPDTAAAIGSRRRPDSYGYYPPAGPTPATRLYQQAVHELLGLDVTDPQAGFKAFTATALGAVLSTVTDRRLSFDTDLLAAFQLAGHTVTEAGIGALHRYVEGQVGTLRDYDAMLAAVHQQALRHGIDPATRPTPVWDKIHAAGSLAAAAASSPVDVALIPTPR